MPLSFPAVSVLDRAQSREGIPEAQILRGVVERAQRLERLGYRRFWVAEHHGVPGIAGSAPAVLAAAVASATSTIRVGTGGIMLPNHQPLVVAEQAATLTALFDGRFDLGLGRSVGFTPAVRAALRADKHDAARFESDLAEVLDFLEGDAPITARPRDAGRTPVLVLATGQGLDAAARAGLAVVVGGAVLSRRGDQALARYRDAFRPSSRWKEPYVVVSLDVAVAGTTVEARDLLLPQARAMAVSRTRGYFPALTTIDPGPMTSKEETLVEEFIAGAVYGTADEVERQLVGLQRRTGADELMVTGGMADLPGQQRSDELLAGLFTVRGPTTEGAGT